MTAVEQVVVDGLKRLRRGRGVLADNLDGRVQPEFRQLCAATTDSGAALQRKVIDYVEELLIGLSDDLQLAARVALNLHPTTEHRVLDERIKWLATQLFCNERTVRRRIDEAFTRMARNAATGTGVTSGDGYGGDGWYVDIFDAVMRLDVPRPEAIETRTIVVTTQELDQIVYSTDIPRHPSDPTPRRTSELELVFGGLLQDNERLSDCNVRRVITLPGVLRKGERHDYCMIVRIPEGQQMVPHYVCVPLRKHKHVSLRVRFHPDQLPRRVWKLSGVTQREIDEHMPTEEELTPDGVGEVYAEFHDLRTGCGYGIQWEL